MIMQSFASAAISVVFLSCAILFAVAGSSNGETRGIASLMAWTMLWLAVLGAFVFGGAL